MQPVGIATSTNNTPVLDYLHTELSAYGTVAIVRTESPPDIPNSNRYDNQYWYSNNGQWIGTNSTPTLKSLLEQLAPHHDYAILPDELPFSIPHVVIGDTEYDGQVLQQAPSPEDISIPRLVSRIDDQEPIVTLESLVTQIKQLPGADQSGAIATFTGRVRELDSPDDAATSYLEFEKYDEVADERLTLIQNELESRDGVHAVLLHHRTGRIESGEDIVFVVVLAGHREEAFNTVQDGINRLKDEVPIFKKEVTTEESFWVHNRP